ncbi:MAG: small multi-drug export protein [Oscillospiraceae bacterium]
MLLLLKEYIWVFFISMLPIIELRGAIPVGIGMDLPMLPTFIVAVVGNALPVPIIIFFAKRVLEWLSKFAKIGPFFQKIIDKATEKSKSFGKYELLALFAFVAIPLPGTGAWTGSLIAAILQLDWRKALVAIFFGIIGAGIIMSLASAGVFGALGYLFGFE